MKLTGCDGACVRGIGRGQPAAWAFLALAGCLPCAEPGCRAAEVSFSIHLDAESAEIIRGMRRANGIDPPDRAADQRLADILARVSDRKRNPAALARYPLMQPQRADSANPMSRREAPVASGDSFPRADRALIQNGNGVVTVWMGSGMPRCGRGSYPAR